MQEEMMEWYVVMNQSQGFVNKKQFLQYTKKNSSLEEQNQGDLLSEL